MNMKHGKSQEAQTPRLDALMKTFGEHGLTSSEVLSVVSHVHEDTETCVPLEGMDKQSQVSVKAAAQTFMHAYEQQFGDQQRHGAEPGTDKPLVKLAEQIDGICNFDGKPHKRNCAKLEAILEEQAVDKEVEPAPKEVKAKEADTKQTDAKQPNAKQPDADKVSAKSKAKSKDKPKDKDVSPEEEEAPALGNGSETSKVAAVAGTVAGIAATHQAVKNWQERTKKPEARQKAITFATGAAVCLGAVAMGVAMHKGASFTSSKQR